MLSKNFINESGERFIKITTRVALFALVILLVGASATTYLLARGARRLYDNYQSWRLNQPEFSAVFNPFRNLFQSTPTTSISSIQPVKILSEESPVIDVVKRGAPAVVSVIASGEVPKLEECIQRRPQFEGLPLEFQNFFDMPTLCQNGTEKRRIGAGSGFIVSADGYILTNKHVVSDEKAEYTVVLNDEKHFGKKVKAAVLARDPNNDVAVLKIDLTGLPYLNFGDSDKLQVGQTAIVIGYALGQFDNTVSKGVVSGLARSVQAGGMGEAVEQLRGLIQTDAAINPGNSGGPLLDINGNVIGMSVAMANAQSIGFAIPGNNARVAYEQVRVTGKIKEAERPFLGVRYQPITAELQASNHLAVDYGMLVSRGDKNNELAVVPGSPADKSDIVENDIILEVDGKQLNERYFLSDAIASHKPGDTIELKINHRGENKTIRVVLGTVKG